MARFVMVHGAFGGAYVWDFVKPGLEAAGHRVDTLDLPGQGNDQTPLSEVSLDAYTNRVIEVLEQGPPAVLVGHSMGGMSVTQAAARRPELVESLIYVAAFAPEDGESLLALTRFPEAAGDMIQGKSQVSGDPPVARLSDEDSIAARYNCCTPERAAWALERARVQPVVPMGQPLQIDPERFEEFKALPRRYVMCLQDHSIMPAMQRLMLERAGCSPVIELDTDHSPQLSASEELVTALDQLARLGTGVVL